MSHCLCHTHPPLHHHALINVCTPHSILNASLDAQRPAVGVILNYTVAIDTINQALALTSITNTTIRALLESEMVDQLQSASSLLATSELLLMRAQEANNSVTRLLQDVSTARSQVMLAANRSEEVAQLALSLAGGVEQLRIAAGETPSLTVGVAGEAGCVTSLKPV